MTASPCRPTTLGRDASIGERRDEHPTVLTSSVAFRPLVSDVIVNTNGGTPFDSLLGSAQLYDETIGAAVFAQGGLTMPMTYNFMLDLSHLYTLSVLSSACCGGVIDFGVKANIAPVPESESTLTFFVVGLGALLLAARSQKFRPSNRGAL